MASEDRLYTFSPDTKDFLRKFRLGTSRSKDPQAVIYQVDKKTLEIKAVDGEVLKSLEDIGDELPDNSPRFVLLSHPLTLDNGRQAAPYVLLSYIPSTTNAELRMLYAGAKELMRREAETSRIIEIDDAESISDVEAILKGQSEG